MKLTRQARWKRRINETLRRRARRSGEPWTQREARLAEQVRPRWKLARRLHRSLHAVECFLYRSRHAFSLLELLCTVAILCVLASLWAGPVSRGGKHAAHQLESLFQYHGSRLDRASNLNLSAEETGFKLGDAKWP